jgi:V8-like Glu-specific endopeptidase
VNDLILEKPAAGNPFDIAGQEIGSLLRFTPQGSYSHRVKVSGTVTYYEPGSAVFIQDEKQGVGLYCQTRQRNEVKPGDSVEVLGFPAKGEYTRSWKMPFTVKSLMERHLFQSRWILMKY